MATTIQLRPETKARLDSLKVHSRESYDSVVARLSRIDLPSGISIAHE